MSKKVEIVKEAVLRVALPEDVVSISKLWQKFMKYNAQFDDSFTVKPKIVGPFARELQQRLDDPNYRLAVIELDGDLVGYCLSYISKKPYFFKLGKFGFIGDLYVAEKSRRLGFGRMMVKDALDFFKRKKVKQIELLVANDNISTIKFWEKLGFKTLLQWMYRRQD
ncbi:MAG: GNAT family N-acetyltransferase [candidate division Zixibacteria bacterium]|nr:GNAT family N-acetyltransferase [candidate division Zixibacteria bacterium]